MKHFTAPCLFMFSQTLRKFSHKNDGGHKNSTLGRIKEAGGGLFLDFWFPR